MEPVVLNSCSISLSSAVLVPSTSIVIVGTYGEGVVKAIMQSDGNLVLYDAEQKPKFSTGTYGNPGSLLVFGQSCNFMVVSPDNKILWQSRDSCGKPVFGVT